MDNSKCVVAYGGVLTKNVDTLFVMVEEDGSNTTTSVYGLVLPFYQNLGIFAMMGNDSNSSALTLVQRQIIFKRGGTFSSWLCADSLDEL